MGSDAAGNATLAVRPDAEDEFAYLNLNIYTPASISGWTALLSAKKLSVLVWIHGGSYQVGAGSVDAYDGTSLVRRGLEIGLPVMVFTVNYRLGVLGFLHSKELATSEAGSKDLPPEFRSTANLGLVDCKYAIDWLRDNVTHFGGDPEKITAIGESAGASAVHHLATVPQLYVDTPRKILSSSTCMTVQLSRAHEVQKSYDAICEKLGTRTVDELRNIPLERLIEETWFARTAFRPTWDDITITSDPREAAFDSQRWNSSLREVVLGLCKNEAWIRSAAILTGGHHQFMTKNSSIPASHESNLRERAVQLYSEPVLFPWHASSTGLTVPGQNLCSMTF